MTSTAPEKTHPSAMSAAVSQVELAIGGMTCASCAARIERKLNRMDGVTATVNFATEKAKVSYPQGIDVSDLIATVVKAGYTAEQPPPPAPPTGDTAETEAAPAADGELLSLRQHLLVSFVLSLPVVFIAMVPALQFDNWQWLSLTLAAPVVAWGAFPFHKAAFTNSRHGAATMDTLATWTWRDGPLLLSNSPVHPHRLPAIKARRFRPATSGGDGWPSGDIRLGELVFHGDRLGNSHPDVRANNRLAILFDEDEDALRCMFRGNSPFGYRYGDAYVGGMVCVEMAFAGDSATESLADFGEAVPDWNFHVVENPAASGEYRWLQFAWKILEGCQGLSLRIGGMAVSAGEVSWSDLPVAAEHKVDTLPAQWTPARVDLWALMKPTGKKPPPPPGTATAHGRRRRPVRPDRARPRRGGPARASHRLRRGPRHGSRSAPPGRTCDLPRRRPEPAVVRASGRVRVLAGLQSRDVCRRRMGSC